MATSGLGASNTHVLSLKLNHKTNLPCLPHGIQVGGRPKTWNHAGVRVSLSPNKALVVCQSPSPLITKNETASSSPVKKKTEKKSVSSPVSQLIPRKNEVIHLLTEICDTTSIAEVELKLNGFYLHVRRSQSGGVDPQPLSPSPSVSASISADAVGTIAASNGSVSATSLAITKAEPLEVVDTGTLLERAADEGLVIIQSPRIGFFRRSRTVKGKRAPPSCKEKQVVKEGQVICYVEQLGGEMPIESDVSGEVIRILLEDGEPVGYGDAIIAILPSFPGIKKLQN